MGASLELTPAELWAVHGEGGVHDRLFNLECAGAVDSAQD